MKILISYRCPCETILFPNPEKRSFSTGVCVGVEGRGLLLIRSTISRSIWHTKRTWRYMRKMLSDNIFYQMLSTCNGRGVYSRDVSPSLLSYGDKTSGDQADVVFHHQATQWTEVALSGGFLLTLNQLKMLV